MTTYNLHPVAEFVNFDDSDVKLLAQSLNVYYTRLAQAINTLMAASGGNPSPGAITAGQIGYGSSTNTLTSDSTFLWDTTSKIFTEAGSIPTRVMTENIDSTSMTEAKEQPFHQWQITNRVRTPGNIGATLIPGTGSGVSYWQCVPTGGLTGFSKLTVSCWAKYSSWAPTVTNASKAMECGDSGSAGWYFGVAKHASDSFRCLCTDSSGHVTQVNVGSLDDTFLNVWHHFVLVWDGTVANCKYYVDGALIGTGNTTTPGSMNFSAVTGVLRAGAATTFVFNGTEDECQIYTGYCATQADVTSLYNSGAGTNSAISGQSPVAWYHYDDTVGSTTAADSSGNGHTLSQNGTSVPTFTTGLIVASPTLGTQNVISSKDGASNAETQIVTIGSVAGTVNILGTLESNGVTGIGNHPLLDGAVDNDTLAGTVVRGDVIVGNSTPKWARLAKGTSGQVLRSDGTDVAYGAIDGATVTGGMTDVTNGNVSSTRHGFAPKSPADATQFLNGAATPAFAAVKDSDLSTSDVTTNNVSSTKHGFAPKSPADATQFLNGAATPAFAAVKDSDLSTSDITTNNVSTSKHGFAPKGDGVAGHFLDSTGAWSAPSGSGNVTTSATLTADALILGNGTTDVTVMASLGTSGQILTSQGAGLPPHWVTSGGGTGTVTNTGTLTNHAIIKGNGGVDVSAIGTGTANQVLLSGGASADPAFAYLAIPSPQGRLTLVTGTPVMTSDQTAKSTVYYTPYQGAAIPIYDGTAWLGESFSELTMSLDTSDQLVENIYDLFVWNNSGTISIGAGPAWTTSATITVTIATPAVVTWTGHGLAEGDPVIFTTTGALPTGITAGTTYYVGRSPGTNTFNISTSVANAAAGTFVATSGSQSGTHTGTNHTKLRGTGAGTTELQMLNGIWTNKNSITLTNGAGAGTSGVAANTATYVGSIYCTANGQTGMAFKPAAAAGGNNNVLGVWNAYNRVSVTAASRDSTASWTYASSTWRAADNNVANRVSYLDGLAHSFVDSSVNNFSLGTNHEGDWGANQDATNATPVIFATAAGPTTATYSGGSVNDNFLPLLGLHYVQAVERSPVGTSQFGSQLQAVRIRLEM